jgi:uncharacterized protein
MIDRLSIREKPAGLPIMHQVWDKLLFLHWPIPAAVLRPLIPEPLVIDTFDGTAWVGLTPFTIRGLRPVFLPPLPLVSSSHELNVRTYVHLDGVPGVWFFSLDASNPLAVLGARAGFALPYYQARMELREKAGVIRFASSRIGASPPADFIAEWQPGEPLPEAQPETREFFLIERYCLYALRGCTLYRARIFHRPWPLRDATLLRLSSSMFESHDLPVPEQEPLLHALAAPLRVRVWRPKRIKIRARGQRRVRDQEIGLADCQVTLR